MVRSFVPADLEAVLEIWLAANCQAHPFLPAAYWESRLEEVRAALPQAEVFVWEEQGTVLGFVGLQGSYIAGIFVRPGVQSRGIGAALLDRAKAGRESLTLAVYWKNIRAAAFYRREGFFLLEEGTDPDTGQEEYHMGWVRPEGVFLLKEGTGPDTGQAEYHMGWVRPEGVFLLEEGTDPDTSQEEHHMGWKCPEGKERSC